MHVTSTLDALAASCQWLFCNWETLLLKYIKFEEKIEIQF